MIDTLENLAKQPVTAEEVERAKRQLLQHREQRTLANSQQFAIGLSEWAGVRRLAAVLPPPRPDSRR